jgi:hypothetical protein
VLAVRNDQRNSNYTHNSQVPWVQFQEQHFQMTTKYVLHAMLQNDATLKVLNKDAALEYLGGFDDASDEEAEGLGVQSGADAAADDSQAPAQADDAQTPADAGAEQSQPGAADAPEKQELTEASGKRAKRRRRSEVDNLKN